MNFKKASVTLISVFATSVVCLNQEQIAATNTLIEEQFLPLNSVPGFCVNPVRRYWGSKVKHWIRYFGETRNWIRILMSDLDSVLQNTWGNTKNLPAPIRPLHPICYSKLNTWNDAMNKWRVNSNPFTPTSSTHAADRQDDMTMIWRMRYKGD